MGPPHESDSRDMQVSTETDTAAVIVERLSLYRLCLRTLSIVNLISLGADALSLYIPEWSRWLMRYRSDIQSSAIFLWWSLSTVVVFVLLRRISRASPRPLTIGTRVDMGVGVAWCVVFIGTCFYAFLRGLAG